jgi:Diguanylate cyclase, GGDEF domain
MLRRKFWDGEVGLSPYVEAYRQAIREQEDAEETDFQDDGDYIFLDYEIKIPEDLKIEDAISCVEDAIGVIEERTEQLVRRKVDPLLGIFDRGSFDADLAHALRHSGATVGLVLADIDHFKKVNDEHGHQRGDAVLRAVAQVTFAHVVVAVFQFDNFLALVLDARKTQADLHCVVVYIFREARPEALIDLMGDFRNQF